MKSYKVTNEVGANSVGAAANTGSRAITFSLNVPDFLMQIVDGQLVKRLLTLQFLDEHSALDHERQVNILKKVAKVALSVLAISCSIACFHVEVVWMIPLSLLVAMGLSFNFLVASEYESQQEALVSKAKTAVVQTKKRASRLLQEIARPAISRETRNKK